MLRDNGEKGNGAIPISSTPSSLSRQNIILSMLENLLRGAQGVWGGANRVHCN